MKKLFYGALIGFAIVIAIVIGVNGKTKGAHILTYVYSNSMAPLINVNDAFIVWPEKNPKVGDIITYRPMVLKAPYITHRIIAVGEEGYITKGDNSPYKDQDSGEPEVTGDRIAGKVLSINGQPLIIPVIGKVSAYLNSYLGNNSKYLSWTFLILGILSFSLRKGHVRKRKSRNRWRLRHLYRTIIILSAISVILSIYIGSRVTEIKYLVSEYPGSLGDQIQLNKSDQLLMKIKNDAVIPVWPIISGIQPLSIHEAPEYLWIRSEGKVILDVAPQKKIGMYRGYVQTYNYPMLLPRTWILVLHRASPAFAMLAVGFTMAFWVWVFLKLLKQVHGFEDWIPLKTIKDKLFQLLINRSRAKLLGKGKRRVK